MARILTVFFLICISSTFSGCILELAGVEVAAGEDAIVLGSEDEALAIRYGTELRGGRLAVSNEGAAYSLYKDVRLERMLGRNPRLFVDGRANSIGEILPEERKIKLLDGSVYKVDDNVFSVTGNNVIVRASPSATSNVVTSLRNGHFVINLGEVENGWYKVKITQGRAEMLGYIYGSALTPVFPSYIVPTGYTFSELEKGAIKFPDESKIKADLFAKGIPGATYGFNHVPGWVFASQDEIKSINLVGPPFINGDYSYRLTVRLELENKETGRKCSSQTKMIYSINHNSWICTNVSNDWFQDITNQPVPPEVSNNNPIIVHSAKGHDEILNNSSSVNENVKSNKALNEGSKAVGGVNIQLSSHQYFFVYLDGRYFKKDEICIRIENIPVGKHFLEICRSISNSYESNTQVLYRGYIQIFANTVSHITFNAQTGQIEISAKKD